MAILTAGSASVVILVIILVLEKFRFRATLKNELSTNQNIYFTINVGAKKDVKIVKAVATLYLTACNSKTIQNMLNCDNQINEQKYLEVLFRDLALA